MSELGDVAKKAFADKFDKKTGNLIKQATHWYDKAYTSQLNNDDINESYLNKSYDKIKEIHNHLDTLIPGIKSHLDELHNDSIPDEHIYDLSSLSSNLAKGLQHYTPEMKQDVLKSIKKENLGQHLYAPFTKHNPDLPLNRILSGNDNKFQNHVKALVSLPSYMHKTYVDMIPEWEQSPADLANFVRMAHGD